MSWELLESENRMSTLIR